MTLEKVVPRLLLPLQSKGRVLKPSLLHGDCWDGNTATDKNTGEAFVFDVCSFYGHNEYDTANWRTPRHRLSKSAYIENYKNLVPVSEPGWLFPRLHNLSVLADVVATESGGVGCPKHSLFISI